MHFVSYCQYQNISEIHSVFLMWHNTQIISQNLHNKQPQKVCQYHKIYIFYIS